MCAQPGSIKLNHKQQQHPRDRQRGKGKGGRMGEWEREIKEEKGKEGQLELSPWPVIGTHVTLIGAHNRKSTKNQK